MSVVFAKRLGPTAALVAAIFCLAPGAMPVGAIGHQVADAALARASAAAVRGVVIAITTGRDPAVDAIYSYVRLAVTRAWGFPSMPSSIELKLLGGATADQALVIGGQAEFVAGEEVLVFLDVRPRDGSLSVAGLERGKWTMQPAAGAPDAAIRQRHDGQPAAGRDALPARDLEALAALAGTTVRLPAVAPISATPRDRLPATSVAADAPQVVGGRWHEADWGAPIFVDSMAGGHPLFPGGGFGQLLRAIDLWNGPSALMLRPGVLRGPRCFGNSQIPDGRVSVSYDDPCAEIADTSPTLAIGGAYYSTADVRVVNGVSYGRFTKGMVVLDNAQAKFAGLSTGCYEEVLAHELGHAVGLAHSTISPSVMAPWLGSECVERTQSLPLQPSELAALGSLYPSGSPADGPPPTPAGLSGLVTGTTVQISWLPAGSAAASYQIVAGSLPGAGDVGAFPTAAASLLATNVARGVYYVRVVAMNAHGASAPSPDIVLVVGEDLPGVPVGLLAAADQRGEVRVLWQAPRTGAPVIGYMLIVGTEADRPTTRIPMSLTTLVARGVASGTYFVRVVALNGAGAGPASPEILVLVP